MQLIVLIFSFDLIERYQQLKKFFEHINSSNEIKWLENTINHLEKDSKSQKEFI